MSYIWDTQIFNGPSFKEYNSILFPNQGQNGISRT